jgi:predicted O-methyltransferase YrrM
MFGLRRFFLREPQPESWHVSFIESLATVINPKLYVEIGIYEGETFNKITAGKKIAVDINENSLHYVGITEEVTKIHGDSSSLRSHLLEISNSVDLLFIDADHHQSSVIADFTNIEPFMSVRGLVLFHDTYPGTVEYSAPEFCGDSFMAVPKLRQLFPIWNFVTLPVHPGLTIAGRTDAFPDWYKTI